MRTAIFIDLDAIPLDEQVEHSHRVSQTALEISPNPVHHLLEMAHQGQHREHRFDDHAGIPLTPLANAEVFRMPVFLDIAFITEQHHLSGIALGDLLKVAAVVDIGCIDIPINRMIDFRFIKPYNVNTSEPQYDAMHIRAQLPGKGGVNPTFRRQKLPRETTSSPN